VSEMTEGAQEVVRALFSAFMEAPSRLPTEHAERARRMRRRTARPGARVRSPTTSPA
jgi:dGTP triphosphohydrolase